MTHASDKDDFPLNANGPAFTTAEQRDGVPLSYVGEKLGHGIEELHRFALSHPNQREHLRQTMYYLLVAHLALHNMLGKANDHSLTDRLLQGSARDLQTWLRLVEREGDVEGLGSLMPATDRR